MSGMRMRARHDPGWAKGIGKDNIIGPRIWRAGTMFLRRDLVEDIAHVARTAAAAEWALTTAIFVDPAGVLRFDPDPSIRPRDIGVAVTGLEIAYDARVSDADLIVRWLGPAIVRACARRNPRRRRQPKVVTDSRNGIEGHLRSGVSIKVYAGEDEEGKLRVVRVELRIKGRGKSTASLRALTGDSAMRVFELARTDARIEYQLARLAEGLFDLIMDSQARIPPEVLSKSSTRPAAMDLTRRRLQQ